MHAKQIITALLMVASLGTTVNASILDKKHEQLIGRDRYETATMVAKKLGQYKRVILVNGMADGLSAASLAGKVGATIIPVKTDSIPDSAKPVIAKAHEVYIIGGHNAISKKVEKSLSGKKIIRISGKDRCETSIKVANKVAPYNRAYLVNGFRGEADAMSISAVAARDGAPIILTNGKTCNLKYNPSVRYIVVGGRAVVNNALAHKYDATRIGGANRYETNRSVINTYYRNTEKRYFCNGETLVDALSASYLARHDGIVLVNKKENHDLIKDSKTVQVGGPDFGVYFSDEHDNHDPTMPDYTALVTRQSNEYGEMYTDFRLDKESTDKDGDKITYEWKGRVPGDYYGAGNHLVYVRAVDSRGGYSAWVPVRFHVDSDNPSAPEVGVITTRSTNEDHEFKTEIMLTKDSYDKDTDFVRYEWKGRTVDDYYPSGENEVFVRAIDKTGAKSRWVKADFNIPDNRPSKPKIDVTQGRDTKTEDGLKKFEALVNMTEESTDEDGDPIKYIWENVDPGGYYEPNQKQTVRVKAVDSTGSESEWEEVDFTISDQPPSKPELDYIASRSVKVKDGKRFFKVDLERVVDSVDPEGDPIRYRWKGKAEDNYYEANKEHTIRLYAIDKTGSISEPGEITFNVSDTVPTAPDVNAYPTRKVVERDGQRYFKVDLEMMQESVDEEGDEIEYVWEDKAEDGYYISETNNVVGVKAVDATGAESEINYIEFYVHDTPPTIPDIDYYPTREVKVKEGKRYFKVNVEMMQESHDAEEDAITYEWEGKAEDGFYEANKEQVVKVRAVDATGAKSEWKEERFTIPDNNPTKPTFEANPTRETKIDATDSKRKFVVTLNNHEDSTDADNDAIHYEWENRHPESLYESGSEQVVKVRAVDATGAKSEWAEARFTIEDAAPTKPEIKVEKTRTVNDVQGKRMFNVNVSLGKESTDADGDAIEYVWENKETAYESNKDHVVKVKAVDASGAESPWAEATINVADTAPAKPVPEVKTTRTRDSSGNFKVNASIKTESVDVEGDDVQYEWEGKQDYYPIGNHVMKVRAVDATGLKSDWVECPFEITDNAPTDPDFTVDTSKRTVKGQKLLGTVKLTESTDPDGDEIHYEWEGKAEDDYYTPNEEQTLRVRAVDATGRTSNWVEKKFTIVNTAPSAPTIVKTPDGGVIMPGTQVTIKGQGSVDPEGDAVHYEWEGKQANDTAVYSDGKHVIKVRAVDALGAKSKPAAIMFFVMDPNGNGGLILTGPTSEILEEGVEGATITKYTFNVPAVSGHSGNDYGLIKGRLKGTNNWEQIKKETTSNGVRMEGTLPEGKYDQLKFTYYTDHDCMYNKSNITYTVEYRFNFDDLVE